MTKKKHERPASPGAGISPDPDPDPAVGTAADTESDSAGPSPSAEVTVAELERLRAREDDLLRALAEQQNVLRRRRQEMESTVQYAEETLVRELLPVLDDFGRALRAMDGKTDESIRAGIALVHDRLIRLLERQGLEAIWPQGKTFDPELHDALAEQTGSDALPGTIVEVAQPGYRFRDRVLRHAKVIVAGPADSGKAAPLTSENAP